MSPSDKEDEKTPKSPGNSLATALPRINGFIVSWLLIRLLKTVGWLTENPWAMILAAHVCSSLAYDIVMVRMTAKE